VSRGFGGMTQSDPYQPMAVTRERYAELLLDARAGRLYSLTNGNEVVCFSCCRVSLAYVIEARTNSLREQATWEIHPCGEDRLNALTEVAG